MGGISDELRFFESIRPDLVRSHPGQFAVVCGRSLIGVFKMVDDALLACSRAFEARMLPEAGAILITEIAEMISVCVSARTARGDGVIVVAR